MKLPGKAWHVPLRVSTGAFILQSGLSKQGADDATARQLHGFAVGTYPLLRKADPRTFVRTLSTAEIALAGALLFPLVPAGFAGAGLGAFSVGVLGLYLRTPGMRQQGSLRPTEQGVSIAKDVWMLAIALALITDDLVDRALPRKAFSLVASASRLR
jgi:hypothetical protein